MTLSAPVLRTGANRSLRCGVFLDAELAETQIRRRVVALQADVTRLGAVAGAGIITGRAVVVPVGHVDAIDPRGEVVAMGDEGHREPLLVLGYFLAGQI